MFVGYVMLETLILYLGECLGLWGLCWVSHNAFYSLGQVLRLRGSLSYGADLLTFHAMQSSKATCCFALRERKRAKNVSYLLLFECLLEHVCC